MEAEKNKPKPKDTFEISMKKIDESYKKIVYWDNYLKMIVNR